MTNKNRESGGGRNWQGLWWVFPRAAAVAAMLLQSLCARPAFAQEPATESPQDEIYSAMMVIAGVTQQESLDEEWVEEMFSLSGSPLPINLSSRSRLMASGLLSQYQVASLTDYISRSGDMLSASELAAVDGFGKEFASALAHFISFETDATPGRSSAAKKKVTADVTARYGLRKKEEEDKAEHSYGFKLGLGVHERAEFNLTGKTGYGGTLFPPEVASFNAVYYGRGKVGKVILGDFNARFGQGLALWSGFTMSGLAAPDSYSKRPNGLAPYRSYSGAGALRGVAADFIAGRFTISAFMAAEGLREQIRGEREAPMALMPGMNLAYFGKNSQASLTCYAQTGPMTLQMNPQEAAGAAAGFSDIKCSADFRYVIKGTELFGELALDVLSLTPAALAGSRFSIGESLNMAAAARYYPATYQSTFSGAMRGGTKCSNEYGLGISGEFQTGKYVSLAGKEGFGSTTKRHKGVFGADFSLRPEATASVPRNAVQLKLLFSYDLQLTPEIEASVKATERLRTWGEPFRTDIRGDFKYSTGKFTLAVRAEGLKCKAWGLLGYMEGGYKTSVFSVWLRAGAFRVDNWDDRIYVYERDAPGNFNVPAFYGRGWWTAISAGAKCGKWGRAYVRASYQDCPWPIPGAAEGRPGKVEVKLQLVTNLGF